jgi:hypothetical protein
MPLFGICPHCQGKFSLEQALTDGEARQALAAALALPGALAPLVVLKSKMEAANLMQHRDLNLLNGYRLSLGGQLTVGQVADAVAVLEGRLA